MGWGKTIALALGGLVVAAAVEGQVGTTQYELNGKTYAVPHRYEFIRNFRLPWLEGVKGLAKEPDESVWLLIPATELAHDVPGYTRDFHGYSTDVPADIVVNVLGGKDSREFQQDRTDQLRMVADAIASGEGREPDKASGMERVYSRRGITGTPAEGFSSFFLMPRQGPGTLPADWAPPRCLGSPDVKRRERYDCSYVIYRDGLTFHFMLRQENIGVANLIPDYAMSRLSKWQG
jgi:hypothetical protein